MKSHAQDSQTGFLDAPLNSYTPRLDSVAKGCIISRPKQTRRRMKSHL
jgi:hypothetical protein